MSNFERELYFKHSYIRHKDQGDSTQLYTSANILPQYQNMKIC